MCICHGNGDNTHLSPDCTHLVSEYLGSRCRQLRLHSCIMTKTGHTLHSNSSNIIYIYSALYCQHSIIVENKGATALDLF